MGAVYRALDRVAGVSRALKVMHGPRVEEAREARRFLREASVASHIESPHVARVLDAGIDEERGLPWMAMELLDGRDLASYLTAHGPLPLRQTVRLCEALCDALTATHDAGVVHRDVKPDNVFLARVRGRLVVKLLDFGIATAHPSEPATDAVGTPAFMPPEQFLGGVVTPATDLWALGLLVFRVLTGHHFWNSADGRVRPGRLAHEVLSARIPPGSERAAEMGAVFPRELDPWLAQCLSRDPALRFRDAREAYGALARTAAPAAASDGAIGRVVRPRRPVADRAPWAQSVGVPTAMAALTTSVVVGVGTALAVAGGLL
jgi:serine/threonine protein kinase